MFDKQEKKTQNEVRDVDRDINSLRILIQQLFAAQSDEIKQSKETIMAGITDLQAIEAAEKADLATLTGLITQILAAVASGSLNPAQAQALLDSMTADDATIKTNISAIQAALPTPQVPVAPAPPAV